MAALTIINPALIALSGPLKGKKISIKKDHFTLGNNNDSDLVVPGDKVSRNHAEIDKDQFDAWRIVSKSEVGVLVNKQSIQTASLNIGDLIQIGETTLLKFDGKKIKTTSKKENIKQTAGEGIKVKKPIIYLLAFYLLLMAGVGIYLSVDIKKQSESGLSSEYVNHVLDSTKEYLNNLTTDSSNESLNATFDIKRDLSASYYNIKNTKNSTSKENYINSLIDEIEKTFFRAWRLEQTGNLQQAKKEYYKILSMVPDNKAVTTKVSKWRIGAINEKIDNDR